MLIYVNNLYNFVAFRQSSTSRSARYALASAREPLCVSRPTDSSDASVRLIRVGGACARQQPHLNHRQITLFIL